MCRTGATIPRRVFPFIRNSSISSQRFDISIEFDTASLFICFIFSNCTHICGYTSSVGGSDKILSEHYKVLPVVRGPFVSFIATPRLILNGPMLRKATTSVHIAKGDPERKKDVQLQQNV